MNWMKLSPDEKVRYFKDNPAMYVSELIRVRDEYRISPEELKELKKRIHEQLTLPRQSEKTKTNLGAMLNTIEEILKGYEEDSRDKPRDSGFNLGELGANGL